MKTQKEGCCVVVSAVALVVAVVGIAWWWKLASRTPEERFEAITGLELPLGQKLSHFEFLETGPMNSDGGIGARADVDQRTMQRWLSSRLFGEGVHWQQGRLADANVVMSADIPEQVRNSSNSRYAVSSGGGKVIVADPQSGSVWLYLWW